ncbi:MAG: hypothetical protein JWN03_1477 [Nocardia sp.]|uniref:hypothetical protein n=1 Tax=Nocardia sp. TaxID=1821 RepID=UPI00261C3E7F|nr:hypothetical protein [Nocardia sp.]MCU1641202.1 hypothetical protein [Nocardia sp.]
MSLKSYHTWVAVLTGVAMVWIVPAAFLLAFGHHSDPVQVTPVASLASTSTGTPCLMFCDPEPVTSPSGTAPSSPSSAPGCTFLCNEPPLPTPGELCRLFCELGSGR